MARLLRVPVSRAALILCTDLSLNHLFTLYGIWGVQSHFQVFGQCEGFSQSLPLPAFGPSGYEVTRLWWCPPRPRASVISSDVICDWTPWIVVIVTCCRLVVSADYFYSTFHCGLISSKRTAHEVPHSRPVAFSVANNDHISLWRRCACNRTNQISSCECCRLMSNIGDANAANDR